MIPVACWILGTSDSCEIRVDDEYVSGRHARIFRDRSGQVWLEDLGSTNGTYLQRGGGPRVKVHGPTLIKPGDTVWLGGRTSIPWSVE